MLLKTFKTFWQSFVSTAPKPWTKAESQRLLYRIYYDNVTRPLEGRSREDCQSHLKTIMEPLLASRHNEAISAYQQSNKHLSIEQLTRIMRNPESDRDEGIYYDIMIQLLLLEGADVQMGIENVIKSFYNQAQSVIELENV